MGSISSNPKGSVLDSRSLIAVSMSSKLSMRSENRVMFENALAAVTRLIEYPKWLKNSLRFSGVVKANEIGCIKSSNSVTINSDNP